MTDMTLSDAIRLGAMWSERGRGGYMDRSARCALAAAADACGITPWFDTVVGRLCVDYDALRERFPVLKQRVANPVSGTVAPLEITIWVLNDLDRWTREQIADFVQTVECQQPALTTSGGAA